MKTYNLQTNIGKCRYVVNYCDGVKQHADGSAFFDIAIFGNKRKMLSFISGLKKQGFTA